MASEQRPRRFVWEEESLGSNYSDEEREFLVAIERYKRQHHRPFPSWREVLVVLRDLGWRKSFPPPPGPVPPGEGANRTTNR